MSNIHITYPDTATKKFLLEHPEFISKYSKLNQFDKVNFIHINKRLLRTNDSGHSGHTYHISRRISSSNKSDESIDERQPKMSKHQDKSITKLIKSFRHAHHDSKPRERDIIASNKPKH